MLALLYVVAGLTALTAAVVPMSPYAPVRLAMTLGVTELVIGTAYVVAGHRVHPLSIMLGLLVRIAFTSVLLLHTASAAGVALVGIGFVITAVVAALFFPRRIARIYGALALTGFSAGIGVGGVPNITLVWVFVGGTILISGEAFGALVAQLRSQATTDPLTGLANRASFRVAADREIAAAARGARPLTLVLIDLDDFKAVNDANGHLAGDTLLVDLTRSWNTVLRGSDLLARYGGDEFALLFPATTPSEAHVVLERIRAAHPMSWSVGVAGWRPGAGLDVMFAEADRELYRVKFERSHSTT